MVALGCDIFARSNTFFLRKLLRLSFIILVFPFLAYGLFRRFLPEHWALALILLFIAVPIGTLFGTTFVQYARWASRGFADPMAYILFIAGLLTLINAKWVSRDHFTAGFLGALLLALGIFMKPIVAPGAAVLLTGAGVAALYHGQWRELQDSVLEFCRHFQ
jgi:hypothetical protein